MPNQHSSFLKPLNTGNEKQNNEIVPLDILKEKNKHEKDVQREQHGHEKDLQKQQHEHEIEMLKKKMGALGRFFGTDDNSSKNITAIICCLLLVFALGVSLGAYFAKDDVSFAKWMWGAILPIISLSMGYLFGKK